MSAESDGNIDHAKEFCEYFIGEVVGPFLQGRSEDTPSVWHGVNCDVDTKEEVALTLVIFFICDGLHEREWFGTDHRIYMVTTHTKALPFLPLYIETMIEIVELFDLNYVGISEEMVGHFEDLLHSLFDDRNSFTYYPDLKPSAELERARFDLICQMKE